MRNSPLQTWKSPPPEIGWSIDAAPRVRLGILFVVFALPLFAVAGRLVWLQVLIPERFQTAWTTTRESYESIPTDQGRILTRDGQVLAYDQPRYAIKVHYRWLEDPVDPVWLKARARDLLPKTERRNPQRIEEAQAQILEQREALWNRLAELTGRSLEELSRRRAEIQTRVETIAQQAEARRATRRALPALPEGSPWWSHVWRELSTPPERESTDPIIVTEELDSHAVLEEVPIDQIATIQAQPSRFPGVEIDVASKRIYPHGDLAAHIIGWRSEVNQDELKQRRVRFPEGDPLALEMGDQFGRSGLERSYDSRLRGVRGLKRVVRNYANELIETEVVRPPRSGQDLVVSIDLDLQREAEQLLDHALREGGIDTAKLLLPATEAAQPIPQAGAIVLLDVRSGEVLVAAGGPRFDLSSIQNREQWTAWNNDPRHPFTSRITQAAAPPGSIFKLVTAIAGLQQGMLSPTELFHCQGFLKDPDSDRCSIFRTTGRGHGDVDLVSALGHSCNVYFFDLAHRLGPDPIERWARQLGFGSPTGIDLNGERAGHVPSRSRATRNQRWYPGTTSQFAIGQADLTVTPLQVARLMALIANGGQLVRPQLMLPESSEGSSEIELASAKVIPGQLSAKTLQTLQYSLTSTVADPQSNSHAAEVAGITVAGLSGTATVGSDRPPHAWFAGFVPADQPRYAVAIFLEHGGSAELSAAPLARQLFLSMIEADLLHLEN